MTVYLPSKEDPLGDIDESEEETDSSDAEVEPENDSPPLFPRKSPAYRAETTVSSTEHLSKDGDSGPDCSVKNDSKSKHISGSSSSGSDDISLHSMSPTRTELSKLNDEKVFTTPEEETHPCGDNYCEPGFIRHGKVKAVIH